LIAILSATWDEIGEIKKELFITQNGTRDELEFVRGTLRGKSVLLGRTGVGIRRARKGTSLVIQKFKPELIISAGFGGALSPDLKVGDVLLGEWVLSLKKNERRDLLSELPELENDFKKGGILTENRFIHNPGEKKKLFETSGALAVDMETWGIVEATLQSRVKVLSIRSISDESLELLPSMGPIFNSRGKIEKKKAVAYFMYHPAYILPFLRFRVLSREKSSRSLNQSLRSILSHI
jgi:adenosylhomocysteine nucleosidase